MTCVKQYKIMYRVLGFEPAARVTKTVIIIYDAELHKR